eukprot:Sspe_Gene.53095::Locus_29368_Transcript_3_3_Confidence_0.714_Length_1655::g.53095::m.53095
MAKPDTACRSRTLVVDVEQSQMKVYEPSPRCRSASPPRGAVYRGGSTPRNSVDASGKTAIMYGYSFPYPRCRSSEWLASADHDTPGVGSYSGAYEVDARGMPTCLHTKDSRMGKFNNRLGGKRTSFGNCSRKFEYQTVEGADSPGVGRYDCTSSTRTDHARKAPATHMKGEGVKQFRDTLVLPKHPVSGTAGPGTYESFRSEFNLVHGSKRTRNT